MPKTASLPFKGNPSHTQGFGARPSVYAKYGLDGHAGDDWVLPEGTALYSPVEGKVLRHGFDANGWGKWLQLWDPNQKLVVLIAHLSSAQVISGAGVRKGQLVARSGNTGFSEAPHVHVAAADTDSSGNRTNTGNGFKGWYSILDSGRINLVPLGEDVEAPPPSNGDDEPAPAPTSAWSEIFAKYYAGWDETAAKADFAQAYDSDLSRLQIARDEAVRQTQVPKYPALPL